MNTIKIEKLVELINDLVNISDSSIWQQKRDAILAQCGDNDKTNLEEFVSWFAEPQE